MRIILFFPFLNFSKGIRVSRDKANCPHVGHGPMGAGGNALRGDLSKGSKPIFMRVFEKTTKNLKRLGRQARLRIERSTSRLLVQAQKRSASGGA